MKNFRLNKIIFQFSFWIILIGSFHSCATYTRNFTPVESSISTFSPHYLENFKEGNFKVSIEAFGNQFGGIMVAKRFDENHFRFVMMNEFGGKLLDFELINQKLELNFAIEQLDRKMLLNLLEKDFSMIFSENITIESTYQYQENLVLGNDKSTYYFMKESDLYEVHFAKNKVKTRITIHQTEENFPDFTIAHENMPIKIFLHLLPNQ